MIYAVQPIAGGPVKIGTTEDLPARLAQLEVHYGQPLAVLATFPGSYDEERAIHERFAHLRFGRTEQFHPSADLVALLGRPLLIGANPEAVKAIEPHNPSRNSRNSPQSWGRRIVVPISANSANSAKGAGGKIADGTAPRPLPAGPVNIGTTIRQRLRRPSRARTDFRPSERLGPTPPTNTRNTGNSVGTSRDQDRWLIPRIPRIRRDHRSR